MNTAPTMLPKNNVTILNHLKTSIDSRIFKRTLRRFHNFIINKIMGFSIFHHLGKVDSIQTSLRRHTPYWIF